MIKKSNTEKFVCTSLAQYIVKTTTPQLTGRARDPEGSEPFSGSSQVIILYIHVPNTAHQVSDFKSSSES
jgi:hypothetical protein